MSDNFVPLGTRIFVKRREVKTQGGLYIPDNSREMVACDGDVLAVGEDCTIVKTGMRVLFGRYAGTQTPLYGDDTLIMNEEDVLAIKREEVANG